MIYAWNDQFETKLKSQRNALDPENVSKSCKLIQSCSS